MRALSLLALMGAGLSVDALVLGGASGGSTARWLRPHAPRAIMPAMGMEELEFIIHADGRVEERVRGVKGQDCNAVTSEINKQLGEVYATKPTEEMYEQKVKLNVDVEASVNAEGGKSSGSWSSW
ncbi:hypothetical protein AB1Y20_018224 [Prymnesium parvum]|uniref:Uncharacterized protein n=1 Tax=Prymnesium parvum TaxID=97485 RepID=A0AB34JMU3_PRYPA